jgi:hypothetical protein
MLDFDPDFKPYEGLPEPKRDSGKFWGWLFIAFVVTATFCGAVIAFLGDTAARAHEAPSGKWTYPPGCCRSAEEPGGDCAPISDEYVTERPDGYHIDLPKGAHPKLLSKGYSGIVPYSTSQVSPDSQSHICLSTDGGTRYCFFSAPKGF